MPANLEPSRDMLLRFQLPSWRVTTPASASTRPDRSSPITVRMSVVIRGMLQGAARAHQQLERKQFVHLVDGTGELTDRLARRVVGTSKRTRKLRHATA